MSESITVFFCPCEEPKKYKLTFDGGPIGKYQSDLCPTCYSKEDKKYVVKEELIP